MNVTLSKKAGFCFGVERAVNSVYENLKKYNLSIYTYGPIIHNNEVVKDLETKGVKIIENLEDLSQIKDGVVIIRSHGISPEIHDILKQNDVLSIDMTCPYVKKIHKIVKEYYEKEYQIIIVGDSTHPEVVGINGWCENTAMIVKSLEECYELNKLHKACIIAQTTFPREKWEDIKKFLILNKCEEYVEFNTICNATEDRQKEAIEMSKSMDAMIIIGGKHSSNTHKLYNVCKQYCNNCFHIETKDELNLEQMRQYNNIGVTAGASTPNWVINDVVEKLENINKSHAEDKTDKSDNEEEPMEQMQDFSELIDQTIKPVKVGDEITGEVISINDEEVIVSFGYKTDGIIPSYEFKIDDDVDIKDIVNIGDKIEAVVVKNNEDGNIVLSKHKVDLEKDWQKAKEAYDTNSVILVKVIQEVKGGVIALFESLRVFIPFSHISDKYVDNVSEYLSTTIPVKIIEFDENKNNIVVSAKVVLEESKEAAKNNFWDGIHIGKEFIGKITNITNYGAFIDIGGTEGLLHKSEITYSRLESPDQYLNIGDEIEVYVKEFNEEEGKVFLSLKNRPESPWENIEDKYSAGSIVEGIITNLVSYGAFVELEPGIEGLVHISEISEKHLTKPDEVLDVKQKVKCKIKSLDKVNRKLELSIKDVFPINIKGESNLGAEEIKNYTEDFNATISDRINFKKLK